MRPYPIQTGGMHGAVFLNGLVGVTLRNARVVIVAVAAVVGPRVI